MRPGTKFYNEYESVWNEIPLPEDCECPLCNRIGIWKHRGDGIVSLHIPCYKCAYNNRFKWFGYPINGVKYSAPRYERHDSSPTIDLPNHIPSIEMTNRELLMEVIIDQYDTLITKGSIQPSIHTSNCMDKVINSVLEYISTTERGDLLRYCRDILSLWESLGSLPIPDEDDTEYEIKYFKNLYHQGVFENSISQVSSLQPNERGTLLNEEYKVTQKQELCKQGASILDTIMDDNGKMNEEGYRQLMDIFLKIYN